MTKNDLTPSATPQPQITLQTLHDMVAALGSLLSQNAREVAAIRRIVVALAEDFVEIKKGFYVLEGEVMVDTAAVCAYLNICDRTLRRYRDEYGLRYEIRGRKCLYPAADIRAFRKTLVAGATAPGSGD